jgi:hypothetical protein
MIHAMWPKWPTAFRPVLRQVFLFKFNSLVLWPKWPKVMRVYRREVIIVNAAPCVSRTYRETLGHLGHLGHH